MVKPAFLSTIHYRNQSHELIVCVEIARGVELVLNKSLAATIRLGLVDSAEFLAAALQTLSDASALLDDVIMMLNASEK